MKKTKVKVFFTGMERNTPTWPYIDYNYRKRAGEIMELLARNLPEIEFSQVIINSIDNIKQAFKEEVNGYLVYILTLRYSDLVKEIIDTGVPTILADDLYGGSGHFLKFYDFARKKSLPVVGIASSNFQDILDAVRLFSVRNSMKHSRILVIKNKELDKKVSDSIKETFGTEILRMTSEELNTYYQNTDNGEAKRWGKKWTDETLRVVEPTEEEIFKSARMYLALKKAMEEKNADAVTVDCLGLYYSGQLFAYPCLSFFQLNNEGLTGVCEADLDSTVTQLVLRYLTDRPGYVSDPVIDIGSNQIIYAHCVATNMVYGPTGLANPYIIRSHSEDRKGASIQSLLPLGETVTTAKISTKEKMLAVHQGKTVANIEEDKACRTKLAVEANVENILEKYNFEKLKWHRVTFYGDYRKELLNLARLWGLETIEEDKR